MKPKKCKVCGREFTPKRPLQYLCSPGCAIQKVRLDKEMKWKNRKKFLKKDLETLPQLKKRARASFQKWIRARDKDQPCISCGTTYAKQWDASHYYKAETHTGLLFDERNAHRSCSYCNSYLHGNVIDYRKGFITRYGRGICRTLRGNSRR